MLSNNKNINYKDIISILILIMVLGGIFGFIYETIFYRIDLGYFVKRGSTYGPWIPIYSFGSLFIVLFTYKLKKYPYIVFFINMFITGILEYLTGYILFEFFNKRLWDYNTEILNFGNINGYICLRSVLFFGLSSLFLIYILVPLLIKLFNKNKKVFKITSLILGIIYLIDFIIYVAIN